MADTQGEGSKIFCQSAMSRITSADELDRYIRVTNPSAWVVLFAAILLLSGLIVWSATAIIPTTVLVTGVAENGVATCWVDRDTQQKIEERGVGAKVHDTTATSITIDDIPLSQSEVKSSLQSDYLANEITLTDWNYQMTMDVDGSIAKGEKHLVPISITVSETHPIDLVLGKE